RNHPITMLISLFLQSTNLLHQLLLLHKILLLLLNRLNLNDPNLTNLFHLLIRFLIPITAVDVILQQWEMPLLVALSDRTRVSLHLV
ncbi:hypothetical protein, partial [Methanohalophilus portucalensis]|uniref:hypothetical protein n=1 Tax=Methanohalophilus portucalensis TaxID=39664 RepID=UPI0013013CAF